MPVTATSSRTPHGVRGLKLQAGNVGLADREGRTPHGVRGLKYHVLADAEAGQVVAPLTGCVD